LKKPQFIVVLIATLLCVAVIIFVPRSKKEGPGAGKENTENQTISTQTILDGAKTALTGTQKISLLSIENQLNTAKSPADRAVIYRQLSKFWADSAHRIEPYLYYTYSAALLENSEKSLTFAAQLLVDNLTTQEAPPAIQNWIAVNAKVLLEKALVINPKNDSAIINLGACYLFGNISDNPMEGILKVKAVVDKNPNNIYGNMMLGLGGKKSGQYPKAIERFLSILKLEPNNMEAMLNLAECYELNGQKDLAIQWYTKMKVLVNNPEAKDAIEKRTKELKK
jgi:tetratricopeptide (TPR) repeat protein